MKNIRFGSRLCWENKNILNHFSLLITLNEFQILHELHLLLSIHDSHDGQLFTYLSFYIWFLLSFLFVAIWIRVFAITSRERKLFLLFAQQQTLKIKIYQQPVMEPPRSFVDVDITNVYHKEMRDMKLRSYCATIMDVIRPETMCQLF